MMYSDQKRDKHMWHNLAPPPARHLRVVRITRICGMVLALGRVAAALWAQDVNAPPPYATAFLPRAGVQITSVSGYEVYYSSSLPNNGVGFQPTATNLPSDMGAGGSITFDWTKFTQRTTFSLSYTPSYTARLRYSSLDAFNHLFSLNLTRKFARRWNFGLSIGANLSNYEESLFAPTTLSNIAAIPATFNDLAAGLLASKFTNNPQLGVTLTNSPLIQSPVSNLLYGERMFTSSATTSLSYSFSPRLSISFSGGGNRTQQVSPNQALNVTSSYVIPDTTSAIAGIALSYSLSRLTQLGASVNANWISSSVVSSYTTTSLAILGRTLRRRWLMQVHGGVGVTDLVRGTLISLPTEPRPVIGGSLGYKTLSHTFLGSYDRTTSDSYGLAASTNSSANATWRWRRAGRPWWLDTSLGWQQLTGNAIANISGWRMTAGLSRAVAANAVLLTEYSYLNYSGGLQAASRYHSAQSAIRVVVTWIPQPIMRQ